MRSVKWLQKVKDDTPVLWAFAPNRYFLDADRYFLEADRYFLEASARAKNATFEGRSASRRIR
jgi:hypothetical protein